MDIQDLNTIAVIGLGKMGGDWVVSLLEGGYKVFGYDSSEESRKTAVERIKKGLSWVARKRKDGDESFVEEALSRFTLVDTEEEFVEKAKSAQVMLEVVFEDLKLKCELFSRIVPKLPENVIIWTNTSSLSIGTMAEASGRPSKFLGTHGMNPVYQMPAVEVVSHEKLDSQVLEFTLKALESLGKIPFVAKDVPGFWVNKLLMPFMLEAIRALERGEITVEDGDKGLKNSLGHPQGVFKLADFVGNDTLYRVAMAMYLASQDPRLYPPALLTRMFKNKEWGVKTGKGFYEWDGFKPKGTRDFTSQQIKDANTILEV
ncbi:MAG: 3-hydroxyacyl-CoA dehydrogenase family protein [Planctomycetota bacterium]|nr:MAG: 3-hydroxyacyl-CoA dehydrogenase family protein [Planctomycetota bacterium]